MRMLSAVSLPHRAGSVTRWLDVVRGILRRLRGRQGRGAVLGLFLTVLLISGSLAIIPRLLTRTTNQGVVAAVTDAVQGQPGISLSLEGTLPGTDTDPLSEVNDDGRKFQQGMAPAIQRIVTGGSAIVESERFTLLNPFGPVKNSQYFQTYLTLRYQTGLDRPGLVKLISGHLPRPIGPILPTVFKGKEGDLGTQPLPSFQIALDQTTAQALKVKLGDRVLVSPDLSDPKTAGFPSAYLDYHLIAVVSGIFQPVDPSGRYWHEDNSLLQPAVLDQGNSTLVYAYGLIAPSAYTALLPQTSPVDWSYTWRYEIDPSRVNAGNYQDVSEATRSLQLTHGNAANFAADPSTISVSSPLPAALDQFGSQRAFLVSVATLAAIGVVAVAILLLILVNLLLVEREAGGTALLRGRGVAARQLLVAQAVQAALIAVPAAAIGYLVARLIIRVQSLGLDLLLAVATGLVAIGLATLGVLPSARLPLGKLLSQQRDPGRESGRTTAHRLRRFAIEAAVVVLAVVGVYLVRRRGLVEQNSGGVDPYLALVPFLTGLAVGILILRLYPLPIRLVGRIVQEGRGVVAWVGLRRVARRPASAQLPMLALLVAVGVAVFSLIVQNSLAVAQSTAAWQTVGADYRIDAPLTGALPANWKLTAIPGVDAVAPAYYLADASVGNGGVGVSGASVLAIDPVAYHAVTQGTPAAVDFPPSLLGKPSGSRLGTEQNPLPAIVSAGWPGGAQVGQTLQVTLESVPFWIRVAEVVTTFPALPVDAPFIITSRAGLQAASADQGSSVPVTRLFVRASGGNVAAGLRQAIQRRVPGAALTSRSAALASSSHQMLAGGVTTVFRYSVVLVALYAAAAGSVALLLAGAARTRDLSYLRTLGLSTRQALGITIVEQLPPVIIAGAAGAGLGIAIARLIAPALDLAAFAGRAGIAAGIVVSGWQVAALAGGLCLVVLVVIVVFGLLTRHLDLASALRLGER